MKSLVISRGNPYLTMVWLAITGSVLLFLFLIFVFFLRVHTPGWERIELPKAFFFSTLCIVLSSISLHFANKNFKQESFNQSSFWLSITLVMGLAFVLLQVAGWANLYRNGITLHQTSGAFVFLISGIHFFHILPGISGLSWIWLDSYRNRTYVEGFIQSLNPKKMALFLIVTIFWHFLDFLWLILFALLWWQQKG